MLGPGGLFRERPGELMPRSVPAGHAAITPGRTTLIKKLCLSPVLCAWTLVGFAWAATAGTTHQRSPVLMLPEKAHLSSVIAHTDVAGKEKKTWLNAWLLTTYKPASFGPAAGRKPRTARRPWRVGRSSKLPSFQASWERFVAVSKSAGVIFSIHAVTCRNLFPGSFF